MNKKEFINTLRKRLNVLEDSEIEDIISEYEGYIEEKVNIGLTEEEAVSELGDINEIVSDLLAAYKIKNQESGFSKFINKINLYIDAFLDNINGGKDLIKFLIEIIIILLLLCVLRIPFSLIRDFISNIFEDFVPPVGNFLASISYILIEASYIVIAIIFFFKIIEKRYFENISEKIVEERILDEEKKDKEKTTKKAIKKEIEEKTVVKKHSFSDSLIKVCIVILKAFALFFIFGLIFYQLGITIAIGFMIYLLAKGVTYFGVFILLIGLFMSGAFLLKLGINFVFNKKIKATVVFAELISLIIVTGVGISITAAEVANTDIIYNYSTDNIKTVSKEIDMTNDLRLYNYTDMIENNTLGDKVRIEYKYPDFNTDMEYKIDLIPCRRGYCLDYDLTRFNHKDFNRILIDSLKDKKIYINDFKVEKIVYASKKNIAKLRDRDYYEDEIEDSYNFTKTFYVSSKTEDNSGLYYLLTIYRFQNVDEAEVVKVSKSLLPDLTTNNYYEFTFEVNNIIPEDEINSIFKNCKLIKINPTNKVGLSQIQESVTKDYE